MLARQQSPGAGRFPAPDVILFSYEMSGVDAAAFVAEVQARSLEARVVVYNAPDDLMVTRTLLDAGAAGYVLRSDPGAHILEAIRATEQGKPWLSPTLGAQAVVGGENGDVPDLRETEWKVLALLAQGLENKEMAAQLALADSTVKNTVSTLKGVLGATNRGQLVLMAVELAAKFSRRKGEGGRGSRR